MGIPTHTITPETARRWLKLSVFSLILAGLFSIVLVAGRTPPLDQRLPDADLFKRSLVVHVNLAFMVWFYAYLGVLVHVVRADRPTRKSDALGLGSAVLGISLIVAVPFVTWAPTVLSNYIPVVDHSLFVVGLAAFFASLIPGIWTLFRSGIAAGTPNWIPTATRHGVRAAAIAYLLAMLTFAVAARVTPAGLSADARYEFLFWGGGHVLQFANVAAMTACWFLLLGRALGREPIPPRVAAVLYTIFLLPLSLAPIWTAQGTDTGLHRVLFTRLMQFGIFPFVLVLLGLCVHAIRRERKNGFDLAAAWREPWLRGFAASAGLSVAGFAFGAAIRGSTTVIPAHYHASIGAVTVAYMATSYLLLTNWGRLPMTGTIRRIAAWQPSIYGFGQVVFALGFGLAGMQGLARKTYGVEQHVRTLTEKVGLGIMATGGMFAVAGGVLFLWIMARAHGTSRAHRGVQPIGRAKWRLKALTGILFKG